MNLEAVYPDPRDPSIEFCFEELRAQHRGWLGRDWKAESEDVATSRAVQVEHNPPEKRQKKKHGFEIFADTNMPVIAEESVQPQQPVDIGSSLEVISLNKENDENAVSVKRQEADENAKPSTQQLEQAAIAKRLRREERANRTRRIQVMEVKHVSNETKTIQLNMASPTGPKIRRKKTAEPTMTINTKEAMDEIYGIFSQPANSGEEKVEDEEEEDSDDDDDYTSGGESTTTGKISAAGSDYGEETRNEILQAQAATEEDEQESAERIEVTGWSDFTNSKHAPQESERDQEPAQKAKMQIFQDDVAHASLTTPDQDELVTPMEDDEHQAYVPEPPEDYEPMTAQFRNATAIAQNRLPFMTPIVERTESSLGTFTARPEKDYFTAKTPCRTTHGFISAINEADDDVPLSSPFEDLTLEAVEERRKILQPIRTKTTKGIVTLDKRKAFDQKSIEPANKGPIILDHQCNPVDPALRETILSQIRPALSSYEGYHEHRQDDSGRGQEVRKFAKAVAKAGKSTSNLDKTATTLSLPPMLRFEGTDGVYAIRRELGAGAFAPVYLAERTISSAPDVTNEDQENEYQVSKMGRGTFAAHHRPSTALEAIKVESNPPSAWEFYMLRQTHRRLGVFRASESIVHAYEMHMFRNEGFLIEQFRDQGTLLDVVNMARGMEGVSGGTGVGVDETLAMFFTIELLRTVEALHKNGIIHGDIKGDNVMLRFDAADDSENSSSAADTWSASYRSDGSHGWKTKGITLIDFGRGIDVRAFRPDVQFIADWATSDHDCAEMRELRPWTYQVDYHGLAGTIHSLLFGKYMSTIAERTSTSTASASMSTSTSTELAASVGGGLGTAGNKRYRIRESFKRYWQQDLWSKVFDVLLNPMGHVVGEEGNRLPVTKTLKRVREGMEEWVERNCEKGIGLMGMIRKVEGEIGRRRR